MSRLHPSLWRPINYEKYFQKALNDAEGRRLVLLAQIQRLVDARWIGSPASEVVSLHLLDWDLRKDGEERFNKHIPMVTSEREILAWYAGLGLLISSDPKQMRYTLTHHVFENMRRRDAVEISPSRKMDGLYAVERVLLHSTGKRRAKMLRGALGSTEDESDDAHEQTLVKIKVGISRVAKLLAPITGLRERLHAIADEKVRSETCPWTGTLDLAQKRLLFQNEDLQRHLAAELQQAAGCFRTLLKLPLETEEYGHGANILLGNGDCANGDKMSRESEDSLRPFLASLALVTFLSPPTLSWECIALIPGVSCIEAEIPESSEGFFLVLKKRWSDERWLEWLLLANLWAREKAVFDLKWREARKTSDIIGFADAHDLRSSLQHAVIDPLKQSVEDADPTEATELIAEVQAAIGRVEQYSDNVSFMLSGFADLLTPGDQVEWQALDAKSIQELLVSDKLALKQVGKVPRLRFEPERGLNVVLRISKRSFRVLLHVLVTNAADAIKERGVDVSSQQLIIYASLRDSADGTYCDLAVWNSGTILNKPVIEHAGPRPYTTRPKGAGLGLYVVETLLRLAGAEEKTGGRHFDLENTFEPDGAKVIFSIPADRSS